MAGIDGHDIALHSPVLFGFSEGMKEVQDSWIESALRKLTGVAFLRAAIHCVGGSLPGPMAMEAL